MQSLTTSIQQMTPQTAQVNPQQRSHEHVDDDVDDNPFGGHRDRFEEHDESDDESVVINSRWESSFRLEITEFFGSTVSEELLDCSSPHEILEFKQMPLDRCMPLLAIRFRDKAAAW